MRSVLRRFLGIDIWCSVLLCGILISCRNSSEKGAMASRMGTTSSTDTSARADSASLGSPVIRGPTIAADSAREPSLSRVGNEFVLRLPVTLFRLLNDSLPGFTPQQQASYNPRLASRQQPLSVVIGDFDGDLTPDVAIVGTSAGTPALILLLNDSTTSGKPRLMFVSRPDPGTPTSLGSQFIELEKSQQIVSPNNGQVVLNLHTDAIHVWGDNLSEVVYLDRGAIKSFSTRGD